MIADCEESYPEMREARSISLIVFAIGDFALAPWLERQLLGETLAWIVAIHR